MGLNQPLHEGGSVCQIVCVTHHLQSALQRQKPKGLQYNRSLHARVTSSDDVTKVLCTNQCRMMVPALGNLARDAYDVSLRVEVMARASHFTGNFPRKF